jgi:hypothetical protein
MCSLPQRNSARLDCGNKFKNGSKQDDSSEIETHHEISGVVYLVWIEDT